MDLSAVIFVALAVAWAVYLVPKALKHHDEVARTRSVDRFSATMRTLARREPAVATGAASASAGGRVVVTPGRPASVAQVTTKPRGSRSATAVVPSVDPLADLSPSQRRARREAAKLAARRRRRVLGTLLVALVASVTVAALGLTSWWLVAAPGALIVMWLVACRAMVRGERRAKRVVVHTDTAGAPIALGEVDEGVTVLDDGLADVPASYDVERSEEGFDEVGSGAETSTMDASHLSAEADPELWEPRPVTLPTYVGKEIAPLRHAKMLHKNEKGVWTSGHDTSDSIMAQDARVAERETSRNQPREERASERSTGRGDYSGDRAVGS